MAVARVRSERLSHGVFAGHLRDLSQRPRDLESTGYARVRAALGRLLCNELRRRGLWSAPPSYLGVVGETVWRRRGEAFDELLSDCYVYVFVRRLRPLARRLEANDPVDPLIRIAVRQFVHDSQKRHDPLGWLLYERLAEAVRLLCDDARVTTDDGRPRSMTLLVFPDRSETETVAQGVLEAAVASWCDDLLPDLVAARGAATAAIHQRLADHIARLAAEGTSVRFGDLARPFVLEVRRRWNAQWGDLDEAFEPSDDRAVDGRIDADRLATAVERRLRHLDASPATRRRLLDLWRNLRSCAAEPGPRAPKVPSNRSLARSLGVARATVPRLHRRLREEVRLCRRRLAEPRRGSGSRRA